ncbi:hypothetical protein MIR68_009785 [Amoeboaphelidium protococcarum]|nr:hypothetical protein MIR68_009785 [Amoeboaphelidium protococcarum]
MLKVLVTVGTTRFDSLIDMIDEQFIQSLVRFSACIQTDIDNNQQVESAVQSIIADGDDPFIAAGGTDQNTLAHLIVQHGKSRRSTSLQEEGLCKITWIEYAASLTNYFQNAHLIITHAGSGSIVEGLRGRRPVKLLNTSGRIKSFSNTAVQDQLIKLKLLIKVNDSLMDNHQRELAQKLSQQGECCDISAASSLADAISELIQSGAWTQTVRDYSPSTRSLVGIINSLYYI